MRIAFVNATGRWGGVKSWSLRVASGLTRCGHDLRFFLRGGTDFPAAVRQAGLEAVEMSFGFDWNPVAVGRLADGLREFGAQVVVTNVSKDNRIGGPAARRLGLPVLQRIGGPGDVHDRWRTRLEHRRYVDRVVVPAFFIRDHLARFPWMRAAERVAVVHNGVDLERFRPGVGAGSLRELTGVGASRPIVVVTSQLTSIKGHRLLLEAMAALSGRGLTPALAVIGAGPEEAVLREAARGLGLADRVHFLGFRRDLDTLLDDAAVAVLPSTTEEGFPNSVIEFMAKGKAVVASELGGVPEAIRSGEDGLLVPAGDLGALTEAIGRMLSDDTLRRDLGRAARARTEAEFDERVMVERMEALLTGVAARHSPSY